MKKSELVGKEKTRQEIARLVAKYQGLTAPTIKKYTEADTRRVFIMPLFHALGWDVYSREEVAEEVKASAGRVDYVFKLHGVSEFYLEAKALRADLTKPEYIKQAITYAYNKGITWAVLTDFEGLQVYNAQTGRRCINLSYDDYLRDFDDLWLISRDSLESNALNEWAEKYGALPPRLGVEQKLYNQLRQWREGLFTQLYHYNPNLSFNQIDEVIQRLFNRLIFIRTCEDRRIEDKVLLGAVHEWRSSGRKGELVESLRHIFRNFDGYYDSDLFELHLTDKVFIESTIIEGIINGLYEIPGGMASYDFSLIDADVLGAVYEQYLGHVATVVKQRAKEAQARMDLGYPVEPTFELTAKKERRKEHGIYYTPRFITNYIVKETMGRFLKERSHNEILNVKILDPACGSGSFLIRAYDELLNYHAYRSGKSISALGQWERLPILIKNIFGVDLDMQAVEIARLNLLLRSLAKRETLPSLAENIRQGNSLVSGTEEELRSYFGDAWQEKKPFNWEQKFGDIMAEGGFDVVIGNPPWVALTGTRSKDVSKDEVPYFKNKFVVASDPIIDTYALFLEEATSLLQPDGLLGYILPDIVLLKNYPTVRKHLLDNYCIKEIIHVGRAFQDVNLDAAIIIAQKEKSKELRTQNITTVVTNGEDYLQGIQVRDSIPQAEFKDTPKFKFNIYLSGEKARLKRKLETQSFRLSEGYECHEGIHSGNIRHKLFTNTKMTPVDHPLIFGRDEIAPYLLNWAGKWVHYDPSIIDASKGEYAGLGRQEHFTAEKLVVRRTGDKVIAAYDDRGFFVSNNMFVLLNRKESPFPFYGFKFILALLNSKLMTAYFRLIQPRVARLFAELKIEHLGQFPIRRIDFDNPAEKKMHDDLVALGDKMLELNKRLAPICNTPCNERDELLRDVEDGDKEINNLVYKLYALTEEEKEIVESQVA